MYACIITEGYTMNDGYNFETFVLPCYRNYGKVEITKNSGQIPIWTLRSIRNSMKSTITSSILIAKLSIVIVVNKLRVLKVVECNSPDRSTYFMQFNNKFEKKTSLTI